MTLTLLATLTLGLQAAPVQPPRTQAPAPPAAPPAAAPATTPASTPAAPPATAPATPPAEPTADPFDTPAEPAPAAPAPAPAGILYMQDAVPVTTQPDPVTTEQAADLKYRRLVFSNFYTLNFGLFPVPSGDFSAFLGTNLRPRRGSTGTDWNTAIGYQLTMSIGYADYYFGESQAVQDQLGGDEFFRPEPIFFHRHALMAQGHGGRNGRLCYAMGGGAVMWKTLLVGIEAEGKLGYIFSARENSRTKGVVGGQVRLGGAFNDVPRPQFGVFVGFMVF